MNEGLFKLGLILMALLFTSIFCAVVIPPLIANPDILGALKAGFVNPYASGYSADVLCCWIILLIWVVYEHPKIKHGWICLVLGLVPGVAVGFAVYLLMRTNQINKTTHTD